MGKSCFVSQSTGTGIYMIRPKFILYLLPLIVEVEVLMNSGDCLRVHIFLTIISRAFIAFITSVIRRYRQSSSDSTVL